MRVKIVDTNSAHTQKFIGMTGELILNYPYHHHRINYNLKQIKCQQR